MPRSGPIAIVGIACVYPDADTPEELFENALAGRRAFRRIPDQRLPLDDYSSEDPERVDATTVTQAALIEGWQFDRLRFKIVGSTYRSADLTHWLALDVADRALSDAGFEGGEGLPRDTTGVLLGNTLTGEFTRAQALRLRWPYVRRLLEEELASVVPGAADRADLLQRLETRYKAPFEPFGDESLAGGLSNTIAGRICNYFDLHGGGYTIDGACSSSLLAVINACNSLVAGDLDVALAGGVDLSLDPFELVGFARAGALAKREMRVYEERSEGFWPGEGCGFLVLMREADALAEGRHVHARIRGWGISSDGAGGISRPEQAGQLLAMRRAYARAGFGPETVGYFEGHGTGTVVGDATELAALTRLLEESAPAGREQDPVPIGSIKASIGHTKAAAGVAGLIQAAMAVRQQIVPAMPACERPQAAVDPERGGRLRVQSRAAAWPAGRELRAGVSSMGFGGINAHIVLDGSAASRRSTWTGRERRLVTTAQDSELFVLAAADAQGLRARAVTLAARARSLSRAQLADLAATLAGSVNEGAARAAVVASRPDELSTRLETLSSWLVGVEGLPEPRLSTSGGVFLGRVGAPPAIGFLFPGQGAPVRRDAGALGDRFPDAVARVNANGQSSAWSLGPVDGSADGPVDTGIAQPAIVAASIACAEALELLGIEASVAVGHSLGEISALSWAGALAPEAAVDLAAVRGQVMSETALPGGAMASLSATPDEARALVEKVAEVAGEACVLSGYNGPQRQVISGAEAAVERVLACAREAGIGAARLSVSHAFHSPLVAPCAEPLRRALGTIGFQPVRRELVSTRTGTSLDRATDLAEHLVAQLTDPVHFAEAAAKAARDLDLMIEVGPGRMLAQLAADFIETPVVATDAGSSSMRGLACAAGAAWVLGAAVDPLRLFSGRVTKPFDLEAEPVLFSNPASGFAPPAATATDAMFESSLEGPRSEGVTDTSPLALVTRLVAVRCELPVAAVASTDRFLSDLHLTSIAVSTIAAEAARELDRPPLVAPNEFADATVAELAEAVDSEERSLSPAAGAPGVDAWLRTFEVRDVETARPRAASASAKLEPPAAGFPWRSFAAPGDALAESIAAALRREVAPGGVLLHLPERDPEANLSLLLQATQAALVESEARIFVLVHHGDPAVSVVRTLHQEARSLSTRVVQVVADDAAAVDQVVAEVRAAAGYLECAYNSDGLRTERRLSVLPATLPTTGPATLPAPGPAAAMSLLPLATDDVLLVTGGGKGIACECALALATESGCALGIVGRSSPDSDDELSGNLARMHASGARLLYAAADVADEDALARAVDEIEAALGPVTAVIHGAGINVPASLVSLSEADFLRTAAPKLRGLENLLSRLEPNPLRLVIGFGSVIAQIGLPGEADYAWANERLSRCLEAFADEHPETRCLSLEWSIWSGVGMGERLGRVETLVSQGITAIPPDAGVAQLLELLRRTDVPVRAFVSGRFGKAPTLALDERALPMERFIERVREHVPGVELVVDAELSFESDPYLEDHVYRGDAIVPGVIGLEAMAQVANALLLLGEDPASTWVFEDVQFLHPIDVAPAEKRVLRIAGLVRDPDVCEVVVRSDASDFQRDHLRATVRRREQAPPDAAPLDAETHSLPSQDCAPALDPMRELYGELFFHAGRFRRVLGYRRLFARGCDAMLGGSDARFFGAFQPRALRLGDPGVRDAAIHAIQACVPDRDLLPVGVERIEAHVLSGDGPFWLHARERSRGDGEYVYDLEIRREDGTRLERWRGLRLREVPASEVRVRWPVGLLGPRLDALAREHLADEPLQVALVPGDDRDATARAVSVAAGRSIAIRYRPDGKPFADSGSVSASHAAGHTLALIADGANGGVACDLETVAAHRADDWDDLLGPRAQLAAAVERETGEASDVSATRVWGALECLRKLGVLADTPILFSGAPEPGVVKFEAGDLAVLSLHVELAGCERSVVATLVGGSAGSVGSAGRVGRTASARL